MTTDHGILDDMSTVKRSTDGDLTCSRIRVKGLGLRVEGSDCEEVDRRVFDLFENQGLGFRV